MLRHRTVPPRGSRSSSRSPSARAAAIAILAASLAAPLLAPSPARADGLADEAELHFQLGAGAYQRSDFTSALEHFLLSNRLVPNRRVVYNIARSFEQLRQFADAHRYYVDALVGETDEDVIRNIKAAVDRIAPNVAVLDVVTTPPGATIYIDRRDLGSRGRAPRPLAVQPGKYRVIAELEGYEPATSDAIDAKLGSAQKVTLTLKRIVGTVRVAVEGAGAAVVRVDDERAAPACTAPCDLELPPGQHQLHFTREGYQAVPRQVTVAAGKTTLVTAGLSPVTGSLVIDADEQGAQITIDGRTVGFTPAVVPNVPAGKRRLRVSLRGFAPFEREVDVRPNEQTPVPVIELAPVREITAVSRYAEQIDDAPSSLSVVDGRELRAFGYPTIASALYGVRGVTLSNDRVYFSASIRGIGQPFDYGNRVLVLSDGQVLNDNLLNSSYIGSDGRADLHDVSAIEVVRGPGSLLYGTGAFSGVVNLVTRPREEPTHVHVAFGTYDDAVLHGRAGFHYNLAPDKGVWASVSGAQSDGIDIKVPVKDPPGIRTAHAADRFRSLGTAGRAWFGPVTAQWLYHKRYQSLPIGAYATRVDDQRTHFTDTRMMAEIRYEPRLSPSFQLMTRAHANRYIYNAGYQFELDAHHEDFAGTWFGGEARLVYSPGPRLRITAGGEGQIHPEAFLLGRTFDPRKAGPETYLDEKRPYNFGAAYALIEGSPAPWIRLSGGARLDIYSTLSKPEVVPRGAIVIKPVRGGSLKIIGGRAFRTPSIYEQYYNDGGVSETPAVDPKRGFTLDAETVTSGEIEYSQRFLEDWIALVAGHASYAEGLITTRPEDDNPDVIRYVNIKEPLLVTGGEAEIRREWRRGWMLGASYGYQRVRSLDGASARLTNVPEHLASFRGVVPIVREVASAGLRLTLEAPRRILQESDETTKTELVADATLSGEVREFGLRYVVGVYNIANRRFEVPVADTFGVRTMPQNGRTFRLEILGTYP
jgi:outer membrane receptor protein involved in Fe transport